MAHSVSLFYSVSIYLFTIQLILTSSILAQKGSGRKNRGRKKSEKQNTDDESSKLIQELGDYDDSEIESLRFELSKMDDDEKSIIMTNLLADGIKSTATRRDMLKALLKDHFYFQYKIQRDIPQKGGFWPAGHGCYTRS